MLTNILWSPNEEESNTAKDACSGHRPGAKAPLRSARCDVASFGICAFLNLVQERALKTLGKRFACLVSKRSLPAEVSDESHHPRRNHRQLGRDGRRRNFSV